MARKSKKTETDEQIDRVMSALASETRRSILKELARHYLRPPMIATEIGCSWSATSKHLRVLEEARLVSSTQDGRYRYYELERSRLAEARRWLLELEEPHRAMSFLDPTPRARTGGPDRRGGDR